MAGLAEYRHSLPTYLLPTYLLTHLLTHSQVDFCWPPMHFKVSEWNHNYHVPQCTDLPGKKPGSIWRCRIPALSTGRPYQEEPALETSLEAHDGTRDVRERHRQARGRKPT